MQIRFVSAGALVLACSLSGVALGDTLVVTSSKDNTLYADDTGSLSNALGVGMFAGRTNSDALRRALIAFDLSVIPAGSTINSVSLTLRMDRSLSGSTMTRLHRTLADWGEGTSAATDNGGGGAPASAGDATWIHRFSPASLWTTPGGDFLPTASANIPVGSIGNYTWSTPAMAGDVQFWLSNPTSNFGWTIVADEAVSGTAMRFATREAAASIRPSLTVEYTVPTPGTLGALALAGAGLARRRRR